MYRYYLYKILGIYIIYCIILYHEYVKLKFYKKYILQMQFFFLKQLTEFN